MCSLGTGLPALLKSCPFPSFSSCSPRSQAMASPQTPQCPWIDSPSSSGEEGAGALLLPQSRDLHCLLPPALGEWAGSLCFPNSSPQGAPQASSNPLLTVPTPFLGFDPTDTPTPLSRTARSTRAKKSFRRCVERAGMWAEGSAGGSGVGVSSCGGTWCRVQSLAASRSWLPWRGALSTLLSLLHTGIGVWGGNLRLQPSGRGPGSGSVPGV